MTKGRGYMDIEETRAAISGEGETERAGLRRRSILKGAAWSVPAVAFAVAAPSASASVNGSIAFDQFLYQVGPNVTLTSITGRVTVTSGSMPTSVSLEYPAGFTGPATAQVASDGTFVVSGVVAPGEVTVGALVASAPDLTPGTTSLQVLTNQVPAGSSGIVWGENLNNTVFRSGGGNLSYAVTPDYLNGTATLAAGQIVAMSGGYRGANSYLVKSDNTLWSHGDGSNATAPGTTATSAGQFTFTNLVSDERLVDVVGFTGGGYALTSAGRVFSWGFNTGTGSLGNGTNGPDTRVPQHVRFPDGIFIRQISASYTGGLALDLAGQIWAWGINDQNDTGTQQSGNVNIPRRVVYSNGLPVVGADEVRGRFKGGLARVGDRVLSWGTNSGGQLGSGSTSGTRGYADWVLTAPGTPLTGITSLATAYHEAYHSVALGSDGTVYSWGYGSYNVHSPSTVQERGYAAPYAGNLPSGQVTAVALSYYGTRVLLADGTVWGWGYGSYGQGANGSTTGTIANPVQAKVNATTPVTASGFFPASHGGIIARA